MRLLVCLLLSALLHAALIELQPSGLTVPSLSISLEPKSVDLRIQTRVKEEVVAPLPEKLKPTPVPEKKPPPKAKEPKPEPSPKPKPTPRPVQPKPPEKQSYESEAPKKPRLIERAEYLSNPPPEYPAQARRRRHEGTVTLLVVINAKGFVEEVEIQESSGFSSLDRAAEKAVTDWRFRPAAENGIGVASQVIVPVTFTLTR